MAGSYNHLVDRQGNFYMDMIENMGDAHEALQECFELVNHLADGDKDKIHEALKMINAPTVDRRGPDAILDTVEQWLRCHTSIEEDDDAPEPSCGSRVTDPYGARCMPVKFHGVMYQVRVAATDDPMS